MTYSEALLGCESNEELMMYLCEFMILRDYEQLLTENVFNLERWLNRERADECELINKTMLLETWSTGLKVKADSLIKKIEQEDKQD